MSGTFYTASVEFEKSNSPSDETLDNAIIEASKAIKCNDSHMTSMTPSEYMEMCIAMSNEMMNEEKKVTRDDDEFIVIGKKHKYNNKQSQNRESPLADDITYNNCVQDENCNKSYCTYKHTGQISQPRPPVLNTVEDCGRAICFDYYCNYKHNGQQIIERSPIAELSQMCNYNTKCFRVDCKFIHDGQTVKGAHVEKKNTFVKREKSPNRSAPKKPQIPYTNMPVRETVGKPQKTSSSHQRERENTFKTLPGFSTSAHDFPPLSAVSAVSIAKRGAPVEFEKNKFEPSTQPSAEVHDVAKIISEKQKIVVLPKDIKMPEKCDYTFENSDFDIPFSRFISQHCYLNSVQQKLLRNVWFNGENTLEDRKITFIRLLDEIIITCTSIVKRSYHILTDENLNMNGETITINSMEVDRFNCKLDDAINIFKDYPYVHNIWNDGNVLIEDRRDTIQAYYVERIDENVNILNLINDSIKQMCTTTYFDIARS